MPTNYPIPSKSATKALMAATAFVCAIFSTPTIAAPKRPVAMPKITIYSSQNDIAGGWSYNPDNKNADYYPAFDDNMPNFPNVGGAAILANIGCDGKIKRFHMYFTGMGSMYNNQSAQIHRNYARILGSNGNLILLDNRNIPIASFPISPSSGDYRTSLVSGQLSEEQLNKFAAAKSIVIDTPRIGGTITADNLAQIIPVIANNNCGY